MKRAALALVLLSAPATAQPCSCQPESLHSLFARLAVVFDGTVESGPDYVPVISAAARNGRVGYQFKVHRVWKGDVGPRFSVAYPMPFRDNCSVTLKHGETLLVGGFVVREDRQERMEAHSCIVMNMNQPTLDYRRDLGSPKVEHP